MSNFRADLEIEKIFELISNFCVTPYGKDYFYKNIVPIKDYNILKRETILSQDVFDIYKSGREFELYGLADIREILGKLKQGSFLEPIEFRKIANFLNHLNAAFPKNEVLVTPDGGQTGDGGRRGDVVGDDRRRHPRRRVVGTGHHRGRTGTREVGRVPAPHVDSGSHGERRVAALGRPDLVAAGRHGPFQAVADRRARLGRGSARGRVRPGGADQDDSAEVAHDLNHHRLGVGRTGVRGHDQAGGVGARVCVHVGRFGSVRAAPVTEVLAVAGDGPARLGAAQSGERHGERRRSRGRISHDHRRGRRVHRGGRTRSRRWGTRPGQQHDGADDDDDRGRSDAHWLPRFAHGAVRGVPPRRSASPCYVHHPGRGATL